MTFSSFYLSESAAPIIEEYYDRFVVARSPPRKQDLDYIRENLIIGEWNDFNKVYTALYLRSLINLNRRMFSKSGKYNFGNDLINSEPYFFEKNSQVIKTDFILDIELQSKFSKYNLLDEHAVMSMMNFRTAFENYISLETKLETADVGCVYLSFWVKVTNIIERAKIWDINEEENVGKEALFRKFKTEYWKHIMKVFRIREIEIKYLK